MSLKAKPPPPIIIDSKGIHADPRELFECWQTSMGGETEASTAIRYRQHWFDLVRALEPEVAAVNARLGTIGLVRKLKASVLNPHNDVKFLIADELNAILSLNVSVFDDFAQELCGYELVLGSLAEQALSLKEKYAGSPTSKLSSHRFLRGKQRTTSNIPLGLKYPKEVNQMVVKVLGEIRTLIAKCEDFNKRAVTMKLNIKTACAEQDYAVISFFACCQFLGEVLLLQEALGEGIPRMKAIIEETDYQIKAFTEVKEQISRINEGQQTQSLD